MTFLKSPPIVFVIENQYEIAIHTISNGIAYLRIAGEFFYPENSGCLSTEKSYTKIRVPQEKLNAAKKYEVIFKKTVNRRAYFSVIGEEQVAEFSFKPLEKTENIHIYHLADVHYLYDAAYETASYFGDDTDLFVVNGDIGEVETEQNYFETIKFVGDLSHERYTQYFPSNGPDTFFTFEIGCIGGIVLDCGEDKLDSDKEYGAVNLFEEFRRRELKWLQKTNIAEAKYKIAVSHICPVHTTATVGNVFDIEREVYAEMNRELERNRIDFMLCGHMHDNYILYPGDKRNTLEHHYPVIVGSKLADEDCEHGTSKNLCGAAITLKSDRIEISFTDRFRKICEKHIIKK